jgi:MFS family permease
VRRLLVTVVGLFALEGSLYSALAPLLPHYADILGLSRAMAGVLTAAYTIGLVPGALISGRMSTGVGVRATVVVGLALLGASSLAFGFGQDITLLVAARAIQGGACGLVWGGGLGWLARETPDSQRGRSFGIAFGAGTFGTLIGPALGALANAVGTREVFELVALAATILVPCVLSLPSPARGPEPPTSFLAPYRSIVLRLPIWLVTIPAVAFGLLGVLIPLRLNSLGATHGTVALTFLLAAAVGVVVGPLAGRLSDRRGRLLPIKAGLLLSVPCLATLPLSSEVAVVAALAIVLMGVGVSLSLAPAVAMLSDRGERAGFSSAVPSVMLIAVALGETIGSVGGSSLAQITVEAAPFVVVAIANLITLGLLAPKHARGCDGGCVKQSGLADRLCREIP